MIRFSSHFVVIVLIVLFFCSDMSAQAFVQFSHFGWQSVVSEIVGDDMSCGAGKVSYELFLRDLTSDNPTTADSAVVGSVRKSDGRLMDVANGTGSMIGPICFDPDTESLGVDIDFDTHSKPFYSLSSLNDPGRIPRGKHMRTTVWIGFDFPHAYAQLDPVGITTNVNPSYALRLNSFPLTYGATGLGKEQLFVARYNTSFDRIDEIVVNKEFSFDGGIGTHTFPAQSLSDGVYTWAFYAYLNGSHWLIPQLLQINHELRSGLAWFDWPFMLDTTPPVLNPVTGITPVIPHFNEVITVNASVTDALSGVKMVQIYFDGVLANTCNFANVNTALCSFSAGPFPNGSIHSYSVTATDAAGNIFTGVPVSFKIGTTGSCGSANGVDTAGAPTPSPASVPNNLCQSGTPSVIDPSSAFFNWTCDGSDGILNSSDDSLCAAPRISLKICPNSCTSGATPYNDRTTFPVVPTTLYACTGTGACSGSDSNVEATWTTDDTPEDAIEILPSNQKVVTSKTIDIKKSYLGHDTRYEDITLSGGGTSVTARAEVVCAPKTCDSYVDARNTYCPTESRTFDDECGGQTPDCSGTRYCNFNWRELIP